MKRTLFLLAGLPVLCLFASVALAGDLDTPDLSDNATSITDPGVIKNRNQCGDDPGLTYYFYKNQWPSLTNSSDGGCKEIVLAVGDKNAPMNVCWGPLSASPISGNALVDNAFEFSLGEAPGGAITRLGVSVDTNDWIYEYVTPVLDDRILNFYSDGRETAGDVAHLDVCLVEIDTVDPVVEIFIIPPTSDGTVTGEIQIGARIYDDSPLSPTDPVVVTLVSLDDGTEYTSELEGPEITSCGTGCTQYLWDLNTFSVSEGIYEFTVTATDSSVIANTVVETREFEVVRSLQNCLEGPDLVPTGEPSDGGCDYTGYLQLEYPNAIAGVADQFTVTQGAIPARTGVFQDLIAYNPVYADYCDTATNELIVYDLRIDPVDGRSLLSLTELQDLVAAGLPVSSDGTLNLYDLFDIEGHYAEFHPDIAPGAIPTNLPVLQVAGSPCLALIHQDSPDFVEFLAADPTIFFPTGPIYRVTQLYENIPGIFGPERYTAPLNFCDVAGDPYCLPVPACKDPANDPDPSDEVYLQCFQPDPQAVGEAVYSPDDVNLLVTPLVSAFTDDQFNPPRSSGFKGSFFPGGGREVCRDADGNGIDPVLPPADPAADDSAYVAYLEETYECKKGYALQFEADTRQAFTEWDERDPRTLFTPINEFYNWLSRARSQIEQNHPERCVKWLAGLEDEIINGSWLLDSVSDPDRLNDPGRTLMYTRGLSWRCGQLRMILDEIASRTR